LLERPDCPIAIDDVEGLFYEPYYQLMRQTLLAWRMVTAKELGASDWLHVHVVPTENLPLRRRGRAAPELVGDSMASVWQSVLKQPKRYRLLSPRELLAGVATGERWAEWRLWLAARYLT
jgi:hypothetical protein